MSVETQQVAGYAMAVGDPEDRWDWTSSGEIHSPTRLGDHAAARYRRFRQTTEAIPDVNDTLFGLLLTVESAREELQPYEVASGFVQLMGTNVAVEQLKRLHHVLDEAVIMADGVLQSMDKTEWMGALEQERIERIEWYRTVLDEGKLGHEVTTSVQQEEVLTVFMAAMKEDETVKELMEDEKEMMETVYDQVVASTGMVVVSIPDWFVMPLSLDSSFGLSSFGSQRLEVESRDSEKIIRSSSIWSTLNHPNVAKFLGACFVGDRPYMVHESVRPLVFTLTDRRQFPERKYMWKCMHEIALGLQYLHNHGLAIANFTPDSMWTARFEGKAVLGCGDVVRVENESGLDMRAFATSIVNMWREVEVYHRHLNTFFLPTEAEPTEVENQEFPAKCPKFLVKREWDLLKRMTTSGTDFQFVTDRMSELAELDTKDRAISIEEQIQDTKLVVEDIIMPTMGVSIGECLEQCNEYVMDNTLGAHVCGRIADVLTQMKAAQKTRDFQSSSAAEVVATYCWCLDRLFNLMGHYGGSSLSLSASASVCAAFEKDIGEIHEKLDHLVDSYEILHSNTIHAWTRSAKVTLEPIAEQITPSRWFILPDNVHIEQEIGNGSFATAWRGKWFDTPVVVRRLNAPTATEIRAQFISEADIWFRLNHVNVVKMYGACDSEPALFVCEYAGCGQLKGFLDKYCRGDPDYSSAIWYYLLNAALGLQYLHRVGIVHGDLKLDNILVGNDGIAKLADFGLSLDIHDGNSSGEGARGAVRWKAPECLKSGRQATFASDIFSFAMCMIEAVSGKLPWGKLDDAAVKYHVKQGKIPRRPEAMEEEKWNSRWSLIKRMTCLDPAQRVTIDAVVANLNSFIISLDMKRLHKTHIMLDYNNAVMCRPHALLVLSTLAKSSNRSIAISATHHLALVHYYRWNKAAEKQEIKAIVKLLHEDNERIVKWAVTALANLCLHSASNRALIRDSNCIPQLVILMQPTKNDLSSSESVASFAAHVYGCVAKESTSNRGNVAACGAISRLVALMLDGNDEEKKNAVGAVVIVSSNTNNSNEIVEAGAVDVLVRLMQKGSIAQQQNAAGVLGNLASVSKYESVVAEAGAVPMFVRMLQSNDSNGTVRAATAIMNLTANVSIRKIIGHVGAIPPLVHLVKHGSDEEKMPAASALTDLAMEPYLRSQISHENCIPTLVELLRNGAVHLQERAAHLLQNLALSDQDEVKIVKAGAIDPLLRMVENGNNGQKEKAAAALVNLSNNAQNRPVITKAGGVPRLVKLLLEGNQIHKENAMAVLWNLVTMEGVPILLQIVNASTIPLLAQLTQRGSTPRQREEATKVMRLFSVACLKHHAVKMDVIPALVELVGGQSSPARASAAAALANLAFQHISACVPAIVQSGGVHELVKLLRDGNRGRERENGIAALVNLSIRADAKTAIADTGGLAALIGFSQVGTEREQRLAQFALSNIFVDAKFLVTVFQYNYSILQVVQGELSLVH